MKLTSKTRWIAILAGLVLVPAAAFPLFGVGDFVIDVLQEAHSAMEIVNQVKQIAQAVQTFTKISQTYDQIVYDAQSLGNKSIWLGIATQVANSNTGSVFGETQPWNEAVNLGVNIPGAYGQATYAMNPAPFYNLYPISQSLMSANIASVNIADGSNPAAILSVAQSRTNQPINDTAIKNLEATAQDLSLGTNSQVEQLNLVNGGLVLLNRQLEDLTAVQTSAAEQQVLDNKIKRDDLSDAVNFFSQQDQTVMTTPTAWGNSAATIQNW